MKRVLSCALVLILMLTSLSSTAVYAIAAETATISFNSIETENGKTVSLELSVNNNPGIAGLTVSLKYDKSVLTLTGTKNGGLFSGFTAAKNFAWDESTDVSDDGVLATFTFEVAEDAKAGDYSIEVLVRSCVNENLDDVACDVQNGKVTVMEKTVTPTFDENDFNCDGAVDTNDRLLLQSYLADTLIDADIIANIEANGDVNKDGAINLFDAYVLLSMIGISSIAT